MSCIDCGEGSFSAETEEEMMKNMMPHYMEKHKEMMEGRSEESHADWMKRFKEKWEEAKDRQ